MSLPSTHPALGQITALTEDLLAVQAMFAVAGEGPFVGEDPDSTVRVTIEADARLVSIEVDEEWWRRLDDDGERLGQAVVLAYADANNERFGMGGSRSDAQPMSDDEIEQRLAAIAADPSIVLLAAPAPAQPGFEAQVAQVAAAMEQDVNTRSGAELEAEMWAAIKQAEQAFDGLPAAMEPREFSNEAGSITLVLAGDTLLDCRISPSWARGTSGRVMTMELGEILGEHRLAAPRGEA